MTQAMAAQAPAGLSDEEERAADQQLRGFYATHVAYALIMGTGPQTCVGWPTPRSSWPPSGWTTGMGPASPAWSPRSWRDPSTAS